MSKAYYRGLRGQGLTDRLANPGAPRKKLSLIGPLNRSGAGSLDPVNIRGIGSPRSRGNTYTFRRAGDRFARALAPPYYLTPVMEPQSSVRSYTPQRRHVACTECRHHKVRFALLD